jgi:hypothetical protein
MANLEGTIESIEEDTEQDYSQKAYGKNALVVRESRGR